MGFTIVHHNDRYAPRIICDVCGEPVEEAGIVQYQVESATGAVVIGPAILHKKTTGRRCADAYERQFPLPDGRLWLWEELDTYLVWLVQNSRIDWDAAREHADLRFKIRL